jgi:hypothetical protein
MRRRILLRLALICAIAAALLGAPGLFSTSAQAATSSDAVRNDDGTFLMNATFNSGLHYWHEYWKPGPGVNSFQIMDRCGDGLSPGLTWSAGGTIHVEKLPDECVGPAVFPFRVHTVKTGYNSGTVDPMSWYVYALDADGKQKYFGSQYQDDWMGSYSHEPDSERFVHASVYKENYKGEGGGKTITASIVPTSKAFGEGGGATQEFWDDMIGRTPLPADLTTDQTDSMYKQLWCHLQYALLADIKEDAGGPTWDLEAERPNIDWSEVRGIENVKKHKCNWGDAPGGHGSFPPVEDGDPEDLAPHVDAGPDVKGDEGAKITLDGVAHDDHGTPATTWSYRPVDGVDEGATCTFADTTAQRTAFTCTDDGVFEVTLTAEDGVNAPVRDSARVTVKNVAPALTLDGPKDWDVHRVGNEVTVTAAYTDPGSNDTHTCTVRWDDGRTSTAAGTDGRCALTHTYEHAGMNTLQVKVADDDGGASDTAQPMVVVYDPRAGLLTGTGALSDGLGFTTVAKYPTTGSTVPAGAVALKVPTADGPLSVVSTKLDWLVITSDGKAAVKGSSARHGFLGYVESGKFRGVVWSLSHGSIPPANPLYDTNPGADWDLDRAEPQQLAAGATVIDSGWIPGLPALPGLGGLLDTLPTAGLDRG